MCLSFVGVELVCDLHYLKQLDMYDFWKSMFRNIYVCIYPFAPSARVLLPALQKRQLGFVFLYLLVQDLPQLLMHVVI